MDSADENSTKQKNKQHKVLPNVHPTNSLILPDGKIFKVQKKRQRKIHSCIPCHQRKIRCSRETPTCFNCLKLAEKNPSEKFEILDACKYFDNDKKKNLKKKGVDFVNYTNNNNNNNNNNYYYENNNETIDNNNNNLVEDSVNNNSPNIINGNDYNNNTADNLSNNNEIDNNDKNATNNNDLSLSQNDLVYVLRCESNESNNNDNYNNTDNNDNDNLNSNINYQSNSEYSYTNNNSNNSTNNQSQINSLYANEQIYSYYSKQFASQFVAMLNNLPTKERSDELLRNFQQNVHSLLPILDMNNFLKKYNDFWYCGLFLTDNIEKLYQYVIYFKDKYSNSIPSKINDFLYWYNKSNCCLDPSNFSEFLILLYAVYYTSISSSVYEFLSKKYDNFNNILSYKNEVNKYYNMFRQMNHKGLNNPRVMSLAVLQINVLVQSITNLKSGKSLINISKILRICQFYQLNRDPVLYHALKDKELVQTRRIVWWQIFLLDNLVSFFLNLTPLIKLSDFDTSLLMENLDNDSSSNFSIMYLNCMYRFILIVDDLNGLTNGLNFQLKNEDINKMKNNINNLFITCNSTMKKMGDIFFNLDQPSELISQDNFNNNTTTTTTTKNSNKNSNNSNGNISNCHSTSQNSDNQNPNTSIPTPNLNDEQAQQQQKIHFAPSNNIDSSTNVSLNSAPNNFHKPTVDSFRFFMSSLNILSDKMLIMLQKKILLSPYLIYDTYKTNSNLNLRLNSTDYSYVDLQNNLLPSLLHYLDTFLLLSKKDMLKFNWKLKNYIPIDELILLMQILATNFKSNMIQNENDQFNDINLKVYLIDETINSLKLNWHLKLSSVNKLISLASKLWELMILKFNIDLPLAYSLSDKYIFPKPSHDILQSGNDSRNINISSNSVSCAEIAPRTIGIASALDTPLRNLNSKTDNNSNDVQQKSINMNINIKEKFLRIAKLVEDELTKEGGSGIIQDTDENEEGWFNLGTEEEYGFNSIDDFHFYKNLKSDVIRLFKLVVC